MEALVEHVEWAAGKSSEAHCKHVVMILFGVQEMAEEGTIIIAKTCTEQLQTFHQPKKLNSGIEPSWKSARYS